MGQTSTVINATNLTTTLKTITANPFAPFAERLTARPMDPSDVVNAPGNAARSNVTGHTNRMEFVIR